MFGNFDIGMGLDKITGDSFAGGLGQVEDALVQTNMADAIGSAVTPPTEEDEMTMGKKIGGAMSKMDSPAGNLARLFMGFM
jgi:hypothetical protein